MKYRVRINYLLYYYFIIYIEYNNNSFKKLNLSQTQIPSRNSDNKNKLKFPILNPSNSYGKIIPILPYNDKYHSILNNYHIENMPVLIPNILYYKLNDKKIEFNSINRYNNNYLYKNKSYNDINENNNINKNNFIKPKIISRKTSLKNFNNEINDNSLINDKYYRDNNYNFNISKNNNINDYINFIGNIPKLNSNFFSNDIIRINNEDNNNNKKIIKLEYNNNNKDIINEMYKMNYNLNNRLNKIENIQMDNQKNIDFLLNRLNNSFDLRKLDSVLMLREYKKYIKNKEEKYIKKMIKNYLKNKE